MILSHVVHKFDNKIVPLGESTYPFTVQIPAIIAQSMQTRETWGYYRAKIKYFLKLQLVPISTDLLNNEDGKCKIRARERILVSPLRPIVTDPQQNILHPIHKKVGIMSKNAYCDITVNKNFFMAGEMAYLWVRIDNSEATHACSLVVKHKHTLKIMLENRKSDKTFENKIERF
jgi:hypothetical protein